MKSLHLEVTILPKVSQYSLASGLISRRNVFTECDDKMANIFKQKLKIHLICQQNSCLKGVHPVGTTPELRSNIEISLQVNSRVDKLLKCSLTWHLKGAEPPKPSKIPTRGLRPPSPPGTTSLHLLYSDPVVVFRFVCEFHRKWCYFLIYQKVRKINACFLVRNKRSGFSLDVVNISSSQAMFLKCFLNF